MKMKRKETPNGANGASGGQRGRRSQAAREQPADVIEYHVEAAFPTGPHDLILAQTLAVKQCAVLEPLHVESIQETGDVEGELCRGLPRHRL